jgi:outer membrane receptor protein involved in Fe transport
MKILLPFCFLSTLPFLAFAQNGVTPDRKGDGIISGIVKDSLTNLPIEFAAIAIQDTMAHRPFDGNISDNKGKFIITSVPIGSFDVVISFVGYKTKAIKVHVKDNNVITLGVVSLIPRAEILKEIIVEGQKSLIEEKVDRTVYNAEKDKSVGGGNATDVMRRVPFLSVDIDGNVTLRGSQNIKVLINNKPSTISASNLADALKQISASEIKSVEVITSPSARYDADGSAGIINIILKKNNLQGKNLFTDLGIGMRASFSTISGGYRNKKMGFTIGGFGRAAYNLTGDFKNIQTIGSTVTIQNAGVRRNELMGAYNLGWDYELNKNNYLTASARYTVFNSHNFQDNLLTNTFRNGTLDTTLLKQVEVTGLSGTVDMSCDYTHSFKKPQREFSFLTLFSRNDRTNDFINNNESPNDFSLIGRLKNTNGSFNQEVTFQSDYQTPLGANQLLEIGGKHIMRNVTSDFKYLNAVGEGGYVLNLSPSLSNVFSYQQTVNAGYFNYTMSTKSAYSLKVGGRYEYTTINAQLPNQSEYSTKIPPYGVFVPSINISRKLKNGRTIKAAYNRRIQRPSIQLLNPNIQASNPLNITVGNPALAPEYTNNYELSYTTFIKGTTVNFATFYRNTTGSIQSVRRPSVTGDTVRTTFANIGTESTYGINFFANFVVGKKVSLNGGTDLYYVVLDNNLPLTDPNNLNYAAHNEGWVMSARLSGGYNITSGWSLYVYGWYRARQVQLQGYQSGFPYYSLTLKKEFTNKKGAVSSLGFGAENFFSPSIVVNNLVQSKTIVQQSTNVTHNLSLRVYFSYKIGKVITERERKKKSVKNDDLKDVKD